MCAGAAELPGPGLGRADLPCVPAAAAALGPEEEDEEAEGRGGGHHPPAPSPPRPPHTLPHQGPAGDGCRLRGRGDILTYLNIYLSLLLVILSKSYFWRVKTNMTF